MKRFILKYKIALVFILLLLIANGMIVYQSFQKIGFDLRINKVKSSLKDGIYQYQIMLKSSKSLDKNTSLELIYQDGSKEVLSYDLKATSKRVNLNTPKRLEYVMIDTPEGVEETNLENNRYLLNIWSPEIKVSDSFSVPDYNYLIDSEGRIWFVSSGRDGKGIALGIFLTIVDRDGKVLVYKQQISNPELYSTYPVLRYINNQVHIFWNSFQDQQGYLIYHSYDYRDGELITFHSEIIKETGLSMSKVVTKMADMEDDNLLVLRDRVTSDGTQSGFIMFTLTPTGLKKEFEFDLIADENLTNNDHYGFEIDDEGNYLIFWTKIISRNAQYNLTKVAPDGKIILHKTNFFKSSAERSKIGLQVLKNQDTYMLLFTEFFGTRSWTSNAAYLLCDENGDLLKDKVKLGSGLSLDVSGVVDEYNNINLVWSTRAVRKAGVNYELFFLKLDSDFQAQTPVYRITRDPIDKFDSKLLFARGERYVIWRVFKDDQYQLYLKSTQEEFGLESPANIGLITRVFKSIVDFMVSQVDQIISMLFFNIFPIAAGLMVIVWLFSTGRLPDKQIHWYCGFLLLLLFEFLNFDYLRIFPSISIDLIHRTLTYIFLCYVAGFSFLNWKEVGYGRNFLYLLSWIFMNSFVITLINYLHGQVNLFS